MRDFRKYLENAQAIIQPLKGIAPVCEFEFKETHAPSSWIAGKLITDRGFELEVEKERFVYNRAQHRESRDYRYWIRREGQPLIRFQSPSDPRKHSENAHIYRPELPGSEAHHFDEKRWPPELRRIDFLKVYAFFQKVVQLGGLPPPFGDAGASLE